VLFRSLPFYDWLRGKKPETDVDPMRSNIAAVQKAVECGWFLGEQPDVNALEPVEIFKIASNVFSVYYEVMGFSDPNSPSESQTTQKKKPK
jgi:hypothetical protein